MVRKFKVRVNGKEYNVEVEELGVAQTTNNLNVNKENAVQETITNNSKPEINEVKEQKVEQVPQKAESNTSSGAKIVAPMSGVILKVLVSPGQQINAGDKVVILEAMKMENEIMSEKSGVVKNILVKEGDNVDTGQVLIELE